jgi:HrpA-like RNA helicase
MGENLGQTVGYRTAVDRQDSHETKALFCTDGLALIRELMGQNTVDVLLMDEVHEWNENVEVLLAWAKQQLDQGGNFKLVLMSATLESEKLSEFFDGAPVIDVPGRLYPVEERQPNGEIPEDDVAALVREGRNILMFQSGKAEIEASLQKLQNMELNAKLLPLHGQLDKADQQKCFQHYDRPKVVIATNVAQTSVTIDDIDAVVDTGEERRREVVNGVEGLYLRPISLADTKQRKGRAGRTRAGVYIDWCSADPENRPEFPVAEILRKRLDQTVLRLAQADFDMEAMEFFHQPDVEDIRKAKSALRSLGCLTEAGEVTEIGRQVNRFPVSVRYARMIVEAAHRGVLDDMLSIAAILEVDGITIPTPSKNKPDRPDWRKLVDESESDLFAQLQVWKQAEQMSKEEAKESGISLKDLGRARQIRKNLAKSVRREFSLSSSGDRKAILKAICAGMVAHLYQYRYVGYQNSESATREIGSSSVVTGTPQWVVGQPFDLQIKTKRGQSTLHLIEMVTQVTPDLLMEVAPQFAGEEVGLNPRYFAKEDCVYSQTRRFFKGQMVEERWDVCSRREEATQAFARWLAERSDLPTGTDAPRVDAILRENDERQREARKWNQREAVFHVYALHELEAYYINALQGARCLTEITDPESLRLPELDAEVKDLLAKECPDTLELAGEAREVRYVSPAEAPRISLPGNLAEEEVFNLPDEVYLPGGKRVAVGTPSILGFHQDLSELKTAFESQNAESRFQSWRKAEAPSIPLPDTSDEQSTVPWVETVYAYGGYTNEPYVAYGTAQYDALNGGFRAVWYSDYTAAKRMYEDSVSRLESFQKELREQREFEEFRKEAHTRVEELSNMTSHERWSELDEDLRRRVFGKLEESLPTSWDALRSSVDSVKILMDEVKRSLDALPEPENENKDKDEEVNSIERFKQAFEQ